MAAVDADVEDLDPATNFDWAFGLAPVYDTLVKLDGRDVSKTIPRLATRFEPSDGSSVWTCGLRPGVMFQDGTKCDANAVKAAITRTINLPQGIGYLWGIQDPGKIIVGGLGAAMTGAAASLPPAGHPCCPTYPARLGATAP